MPSGYCSSSFSWPEPSERSPSSRSTRRKKADIIHKDTCSKSWEKHSKYILYPGIYKHKYSERNEKQKQLHVPDRMWLREANIRSMKEAGTVIVFLVSSSISSFRVITLKGEKSVRKCKRKRSKIFVPEKKKKTIYYTILVCRNIVKKILPRNRITAISHIRNG